MLNKKEQLRLEQLESELGVLPDETVEDVKKRIKPAPSMVQPRDMAEVTGGLSEAEYNRMKELELNLRATEEFERRKTLEGQKERQLEELRQRPEAELGSFGRTKYAVEPIQSNRVALLKQLSKDGRIFFGKDANDLFIRDEMGNLRPVNLEGFSQADIAEFIGSVPEMAGGIVGTQMGGVPGAAIGGGVGSVVRQLTSATLGTPQVATPTERAVEVGLSAALDALTFKVGKLFKGKADQIVDVPLKGVTHKKMKPGFDKDLLKPTAEGIATQRKAIRLGIPKLTKAQKASPLAKRMEQTLAEIPVGGKEVRDIYNKQAKETKNKLIRVLGQEIEGVDSVASQKGQAIKDSAQGWVENLEGKAKTLYQEIEETMQDTFLDDKTSKEFVDLVQDLNLLDPDGNKLSKDYFANTPLTEDAFVIAQNLAESVNNVLKQPNLSLANLKRTRQAIDSAINKASVDKNPQLKRFLTVFRAKFASAVEDAIPDQKVKNAYKKANSLWNEKSILESKLDDLGLSGFKDVPSEKVLDNIFKNTKSAAKFKALFGERAFKKAAEEYFLEVVTKSSRTGLKPKSLKNKLMAKEIRSVLEPAIGKKKYDDVIDLLDLMGVFKEIPNPPKTALVNILLNPTGTMAEIGKQLKSSRNIKGQLSKPGGLNILGKALKMSTSGVRRAGEVKGIQETSEFRRKMIFGRGFPKESENEEKQRGN